MTPELAELLRLEASSEPLHPDLAAHVVQTDFGPMLHHPLVIELSPRPGLANARYQAKRQALEEAIGEGEWARAVWLHERPYRLDALLDLADDLDDDDYWSILADIWVDSENIWQNLYEWAEALDANRSGSPMSADEAAALAAMPDVIPVYRGAAEDVNEEGLSWSVDRERAEWFARRSATDEAAPVLLVGEVAKADVIAYFTSRNESEIVVADWGLVDVVERVTLTR